MPLEALPKKGRGSHRALSLQLASVSMGCRMASTHPTSCDDDVVPLICPTRQISSENAQRTMPGRYRLLCMGLFSLFLLSGHEPDLIGQCAPGHDEINGAHRGAPREPPTIRPADR